MSISRSEADSELLRFAEALERASGWLRRSAPRSEWNDVAISTLDVLEREGRQRICSLVDRERITQPGMTALIARLVTAGFVDRIPDPTDGRATLVAITDAGREHLRDLHASRTSTVFEGLRALPAPEQESLLRAAEVLIMLAERPMQPETAQTQTTKEALWSRSS